MQKKIAIVTQDVREVGGVLTHVKLVYNFLEETGFEPYILNYATQKYDSSLNKTIRHPFNKLGIKEGRIEGMRIIIIGCFFPEFEFMRYLSNPLWETILEKFDAFLVITGSAVFGFPLAQLSKKYVLWAGTTTLDDKKDRIKRFGLLRKILAYFVLPFVRLQEKKALVKAYKIMSTTNYTKKCLIREFSVKKDIPVVHIPINTNLFRPTKHKNNRGEYILFVGRANDTRKNIELLLKAFRLLKGNVQSPLELIIAGEKPSERLIKSCGSSKDVIFKGRVSKKELVRLYQNALFFVLPSLQEGCGLALLEAMACGLPVIATKCGGPQEIIRNKKNGILVEDNNVKSLANAMSYLINNPKVCRIIGKNARQFVLNSYHLKTFETNFGGILKQAFPNLHQK